MIIIGSCNFISSATGIQDYGGPRAGFPFMALQGTIRNDMEQKGSSGNNMLYKKLKIGIMQLQLPICLHLFRLLGRIIFQPADNTQKGKEALTAMTA